MTENQGKLFRICYRKGSYGPMLYGVLTENIPGGFFFRTLIASKIIFIPFSVISFLSESTIDKVIEDEQYMRDMEIIDKETFKDKYLANK